MNKTNTYKFDWENILNHWAHEIEFRCNRWIGDGELPYWHNEQMNTSMLATAMVKSGVAPIVECVVDRKSNGGLSYGRADLYYEKDTHNGYGESKTLWLDKDFRAISEMDLIRYKLNESNKQLQSIWNAFSHSECANFVFCIPSWQNLTPVKTMQDEFNEYESDLKKLHDTEEIDFFKLSKTHKSIVGRDNRQYIGCFIVMKTVHILG